MNRTAKLVLLLILALGAAIWLFSAWQVPEPVATASSHAGGRGEWMVYNRAGARIGRLLLGEGAATWTADVAATSPCDIAIGEHGAVEVSARSPIGPLGRRFSLVPGEIGWSITGPKDGFTAITGAPAAASAQP